MLVCLAGVALATSARAQEILTGAERDAPPPASSPVAAPDTARVWTGVTVVTAEGWHLPDAALRWLPDGSRVRVTRPDGSWRDFLPWTVRQVRAADGTDLTATIAAARPDAGAAPAPARSSPAYQEIGRAAPLDEGLGGMLGGDVPFRVAVSAGLSWATYAGDWYYGYENDMGLQGAVRFGMGRGSWMTLSYRRQGAGRESVSFYDYDAQVARTATVDVRVDQFMVMYGTRTDYRGQRRSVPYFEFGLAVLNHVVSASLTGYGSGSMSETNLGPVVQLGGLVAVGENVVMDIGLHLLHKPGIFDDTEPGGTILGVHAGAGWIDW